MYISDLSGTSENSFEIGSDGVILELVNGKLEVKNQSGNLVNIKAKAPVEDDDVLTKLYFEENGGVTPVYGTQFQKNERTSQQTTTSTSWQQYLRLTSTLLPAGIYEIKYMWVWNFSKTNRAMSVRVQVDDSINLIAPGDGDSFFANPPDGGSDQRYLESGIGYVEFTSPAIHTIDMDFRSQQSNGTSRMKQGILSLIRVS